MQTSVPPQFASVRHSAQLREGTSQTGVAGVGAQSASSVHPGTQEPIPSQTVPTPQWESSEHSTQTAAPAMDVPQTGVAASQPLSTPEPPAVSSQAMQTGTPLVSQTGFMAEQPESVPPAVSFSQTAQKDDRPDPVQKGAPEAQPRSVPGPAMVSKQGAQTDGVPVQTKPDSTVHIALQPSPGVVPLSSHISGAITRPSPQIGEHIEGAPVQS